MCISLMQAIWENNLKDYFFLYFIIFVFVFLYNLSIVCLNNPFMLQKNKTNKQKHILLFKSEKIKTLGLYENKRNRLYAQVWFFSSLFLYYFFIMYQYKGIMRLMWPTEVENSGKRNRNKQFCENVYLICKRFKKTI